jgi:hypothetical protein
VPLSLLVKDTMNGACSMETTLWKDDQAKEQLSTANKKQFLISGTNVFMNPTKGGEYTFYMIS